MEAGIQKVKLSKERVIILILHFSFTILY